MSTSIGLRFFCVSNSSQRGVGTITASNGDTLDTGHTGIWNVGYYNSRPGVQRFQNTIVSYVPMLLTPSDQGIYTCTIPDDNGNDFIFNVGLYPIDFNGEY